MSGIITRAELERGEALVKSLAARMAERDPLVAMESAKALMGWAGRHSIDLIATARAYHDEIEAPQKASEEHG